MADITIIMPSFNKEKYIAEALDSVFMQETQYPYHIIIADDCSTDKTVEIAKNYQLKYPDKITILESEINQKLYKNVLRAYEITKTDYFCVLDPDDYWTDKLKIQKALDFLERNKDYTIYVTDTNILTKDGEIKPFINRKKVYNSDFNDYLQGKAQLGCTLGSTFRNVIFKNGVPEKMKNLEYPSQERTYRGDSFRAAIHLHEGKAHCVPEVDAIYRVTEEGLWQGSSQVQQNLLNALFYRDLWLYYDKKHPKLLFNSLKIFEHINRDLLDNLSEIKDLSERNNVISKLKDLKMFYKENQKYPKSTVNNVKPMYRILLYIYKTLYNKLLKKGLI